MEKPTLIDLFCGAGGMSHGFEQGGFSILAGIDSDADALRTFRANHLGSHILQADLSKMPPEELAEAINIKPGDIDCLAGGPPCQGFSRNRAFRHQEGVFVDDSRNHLYWHFFEYVRYFRPKAVVMENVPEILIKSNGAFREAVFERFRSLGYAADARVLNAADFGVPQHRKRAFFLAGLDGLEIRFPQPTTQPGLRAGHRTPASKDYQGTNNGFFMPALFELLPTGPTVWEAVSDLNGAYADSLSDCSEYGSDAASEYQHKRRDGSARVWNHFPWKLTERQLARIRLLGEGQGLLHLPVELQVKSGYGSAYRRLQSDAQALTITTWMFHPGSGMFTHPFENRVVTIREAARLQSFQDNFIFFGSYHSQCRQVGNSVAPLVAKSIAHSLLTALEHKTQGSLSIRAMP